MRSFNVNDIRAVLAGSYELSGNLSLMFDGFKPIAEASINSVTWIRPGINNAGDLINNNNAGCVICDKETFDLYSGDTNDILFITSDNPHILFVKLLSHFHSEPKIAETTIHPTVILHPDCEIGEGVSIGAYSIVGACKIGDYTVIHENVKIFDEVNIGADCIIREFCSIGGEGFGIVKDEEGNNMHVPHIGNVIIGNNVIILPYSNVDRGTLGSTIIEDFTAIDHYCHIGHNSVVGRNSIITAGVVLAGGAKVGQNCYLGVQTIIKQKVVLGDSVTTGMGSVVTKNIPTGQTWMGNPAMERSIFLKARGANE